ncbi:Oidioi.mRNA.OKI2018_I69.chr2.g7939.t1.cds [Oikopleura dioica]|uniref:Oidioi.mRNA.OKI2018_I69.chr2.g7939.t1.cds n=1 Tax=Oikopleura dioica TaxID=34765 RepID=A0ABN7T8B7_OIKDI|nr:Oidioi.mRNA.OKI2018_I69.chr2.g7939.t1.cds [Oikopleura dioica]
MSEKNNENAESAVEPRRSSRRKVPVKTYQPTGDYTDVAMRVTAKATKKKKSESLEDIYTQKSVKSPVIASKALATITEKDSPDPFSKLKRKRLMVFPTDPSHRKPRKRKLTESIKRAAKIRKVSLENDKDKILKEKLEQLEKDLGDIEETN